MTVLPKTASEICLVSSVRNLESEGPSRDTIFLDKVHLPRQYLTINYVCKYIFQFFLTLYIFSQRGHRQNSCKSVTWMSCVKHKCRVTGPKNLLLTAGCRFWITKVDRKVPKYNMFQFHRIWSHWRSVILCWPKLIGPRRKYRRLWLPRHPTKVCHLPLEKARPSGTFQKLVGAQLYGGVRWG